VLLFVKLSSFCRFLLIAGLCWFNHNLLSTRLGQNMRTVGQSQSVAMASGINVDQTRVIAMIISTVLASWGQLIFLQSIGTFFNLRRPHADRAICDCSLAGWRCLGSKSYEQTSHHRRHSVPYAVYRSTASWQTTVRQRADWRILQSLRFLRCYCPFAGNACLDAV